MPEVSKKRPPLYSFRDLVALRTVAWLRTNTSLQKVRRAFAQLGEFDLTDHPAAYEFAVGSVAAVSRCGRMRVHGPREEPGQYQFYTLADVFRPFNNRNDEMIVDFQKPRPTLRSTQRKLGGWPTIDGTRVPFDIVADALSGDLPLSSDQVQAFYPGESERGARRPRLCRACLPPSGGYASIVAIARSLLRLAARDRSDASVATPRSRPRVGSAPCFRG